MPSYTVVLIILDDCSIDSLKQARTQCLRELMEEGAYTFKCRSVLPSVTYTAHASIITSDYPCRHGIAGNCFYDGDLARTIDLDRVDVDEYLLSETLMERMDGIKLCIGEPFTRGCTYTVSKSEVQSYPLFMQDVYALRREVKLIERYRPVFTVVNLPGIDGIGEQYGPYSSRVRSDGRFELVLTRSELEEYGLSHSRSGDIVVFAREGYEMGSRRLCGSHGGLSRSEYYVPLIINKPDYMDLLVDPDITIVSKIVFRYIVEMDALNNALEYLGKTDPAHGVQHTLRVLSLSTKLAIKYGADTEALRIASIFHDTGRAISLDRHESISADLAGEFLRRKGYPDEFIDRVKRIITSHHKDPDELESIEEKIL